MRHLTVSIKTESEVLFDICCKCYTFSDSDYDPLSDDEDSSSPLASIDLDYHSFAVWQVYRSGPNRGKGRWLLHVIQGPYRFGKRLVDEQGLGRFYCIQCRQRFEHNEILYCEVENWHPEDPKEEPIIRVLENQNYNHKCQPSGYNHIPLILLKTAHQRILQNLSKPIYQIWKEVYNEILAKHGVEDDKDLTEEEQHIQDAIKLAMKTYASYKNSMYEFRNATFPPNPKSHDEFNPQHPFNFLGDDNICKYAEYIVSIVNLSDF